LIVFTVNEHENICIAALNRRAGYATGQTEARLSEISETAAKNVHHFEYSGGDVCHKSTGDSIATVASKSSWAKPRVDFRLISTQENYPCIGTDKKIFLCLVGSGLELTTLTQRKIFLPVPIHG
jgi:hypothetical protein